jgi:hypothetical protein
MIGRMKLGYLVLEVRRPAAWHGFAKEILGLQPAGANPDGSTGYRLDGAAQRLVLREGPADDLAAIGLELADEAALGELRQRLARAGVDAAEGDGSLCAARRVSRLLAFEIRKAPAWKRRSARSRPPCPLPRRTFLAASAARQPASATPCWWRAILGRWSASMSALSASA